MKNNYKILMTLGIVILLIPFLGIPNLFKAIIEFVVAILLIGIALLGRLAYRSSMNTDHEPIFEESNGEMETASVVAIKEGFDDENDYLEEDEELEEEIVESDDLTEESQFEDEELEEEDDDELTEDDIELVEEEEEEK